MKEFIPINTDQSIDGSQSLDQKEQEAFRLKYQKAAKYNENAASILVEINNSSKEDQDILSKKDKLLLFGLKGVVNYCKFMSDLQMKYLNYKAEQKGKELSEQFDQLLKETEEKTGEYSRLLSSPDLSSEDREEIEIAIAECNDRLKVFIETKLVYHFSEAELQERDLFVAEQLNQKRDELLDFYPYLKSLSDEEKEYLGLVERAKNTDTNRRFLKSSGISSIFGNFIGGSDIDPNIRLEEFTNEHKDFDGKIMWRITRYI